MHVRRKFVVLAIVVLASLTVALLVPNPTAGTEVIGNLSTREVSEISTAVRKKIHGPILPDLSWSSIRKAPHLLKQRSKTRILKIEGRTDGFVVVITGPSIQVEDKRCTFWSVFRKADGWDVGDSYAQ